MLESFFSFFANTLSWWQWLIVGLVPPAIVALYFLKLKRMPLEVPSTYLWHRTIEDLHVNSLWQRLRRSLLLLLQLLLLLLLIFALMRPGWQGVELVGDRFIFLIDTSASMSATDVRPTRLEAAKKRVGEMIDRLESGDVAMLISFSDVARVEQSFTDSRSLLRGKLAQIRQTNRTSDIQEALRAAAGHTTSNTSGEKGSDDMPAADGTPAALYIFSDGGFGTVADFDWGNLAPKYIKLGEEKPANVGIVLFSTEKNPEKPEQTQAYAQVKNFGAEDVAVEASLYHDDQLRDVKRIDIEAGEAAGVQYELTDVEGADVLADEGVLRLVLEHEDAFALDNTAVAAMNPPRQARVLLITPFNDPENPLRRSLSTSEAAKLAQVQFAEPSLLESKTYEEQAASGAYDLIIYDRCRPKRMPQANTLMVGVIPPGDNWKAGPKQGPPLVIDSDRVHPLMQFLEVGNLRIFEGTALTPPSGGTVLIDADIGAIGAIAPREGFEDAVLGFEIFGGPPGAIDVNTDWPRMRSFPLFVMNVVKYLGGVRGSLTGQNVKPGEPVMLRSESPVQTVTVVSPSGRKTRIRKEAENTFVYADTNSPGIYNVREGNQSTTSRQFAVNLFDARESDIRPQNVKVGDIEIEGESVWEPARFELWKWILIGGLALLIFEWWVFNRRVYL